MDPHKPLRRCQPIGQFRPRHTPLWLCVLLESPHHRLGLDMGHLHRVVSWPLCPAPSPHRRLHVAESCTKCTAEDVNADTHEGPFQLDPCHTRTTDSNQNGICVASTAVHFAVGRVRVAAGRASTPHCLYGLHHGLPHAARHARPEVLSQVRELHTAELVDQQILQRVEGKLLDIAQLPLQHCRLMVLPEAHDQPIVRRAVHLHFLFFAEENRVSVAQEASGLPLAPRLLQDADAKGARHPLRATALRPLDGRASLLPSREVHVRLPQVQDDCPIRPLHWLHW
mmetsp:Transcript_18203/g.43808  ORF Transcript_18203/g.43808 Transcript_18203/m.43808 type:complete len:283 (+) Transcript_18203:170-1018(+)